MQAIAINIGANTNEPGFRGPIFSDRSFEYIPIPESEQLGERVPTYEDLSKFLETPIPDRLIETPVHLDPEFPEYPFCERYTYGDEHGVKAGPLSELSSGDLLLFYATLTVEDDAAGLPPQWGAFIIGAFVLAADPLTPDADDLTGSDEQRYYENNAHLKREQPDARVLLRGDPDRSRLFDRAVPLSKPTGGTDPNGIVGLSADSGRGPWWRRPLRFDNDATTRLYEHLPQL